MAGHLVLFDTTIDAAPLLGAGHTVTQVAELAHLIDTTFDLALLPARHPLARQVSAELRARNPDAAQVAVLFEATEGPLDSVADAIHWPPRPADLRLLHWITEGVRQTRSARAAAPLAELGKLLTQVVHEIRNPLTALSAKLQWLKHKARDNPELAQMSAKLDDEVTRLARMSTDVIALGRARSESGQSAEVWQTLQEVLALYRETCEQSGIELIITGCEDPKRVPFRSEELHQIFQNLLVNAIDATPPEQQIVIDVKPEGSVLAVQFRNPGHLSDDTIAHLFDLFFTTKRNGSGLGLPIVKRIVTGVEGDIVAQNDGTHVVFTVTLPLLQMA